MPLPTVTALRTMEGQNISALCGCGYVDAGVNHCAHFVSHALGFTFGFTCKGMTGQGSVGASIRVHELFAKCGEVGNWADRKATSCLAFVTDASNVELATKKMANVRKKHVGIYLNGTIWHYSNTRDKVVTETPEVFAKHYSGQSVAVFYGTLPL